MFSFRRSLADAHSRIRAMCERLNTSHGEDSEARGLKLLREWLSPQQLAQFNTGCHFDVVGCHTGKVYRIHYGVSANIDELDDSGRPQVRYCFIPEPTLVPGDVMLAQKIALETDERGALAVANRFKPRPRPTATGALF
jgi:hypothetical protein